MNHMIAYKKTVALIFSALPFIFIGDLLMIGVMVTSMGIYFWNLSTILFGLYDLTIAAVLAKNIVESEKSS